MRKSNVAFVLKYSCKDYERDQIAPSCFVHKPLTAKSRKSTQTHFSDGTFAEHPSSKHWVKLIFLMLRRTRPGRATVETAFYGVPCRFWRLNSGHCPLFRVPSRPPAHCCCTQSSRRCSNLRRFVGECGSGTSSAATVWMATAASVPRPSSNQIFRYRTGCFNCDSLWRVGGGYRPSSQRRRSS